jgi:hypothetical protein
LKIGSELNRNSWVATPDLRQAHDGSNLNSSNERIVYDDHETDFDDGLSDVRHCGTERGEREWRHQEQCLVTSIGELNEARPERLLDAVRILELANKAHFLYLRQNSAEKAKLLKIAPSNCAINATNVYPTYRKLFDLIFQAAQTEKWWAWGESTSRQTVWGNRYLC